MKHSVFFIFTLLVTIIQGYVSCESRIRRAVDLPVPDVWQLHSSDNQTELISWYPLESGDVNEPIIGYKIKVWEEPGERVLRNETIKGEVMLVERILSPPKYPKDKIYPESEATVYIRPQNHPSVELQDIQTNVRYVVKVQVYTPYRDGPQTKPYKLLRVSYGYKVIEYY